MRQNQRFEFQKAVIDVMMKYLPSLGLDEAEKSVSDTKNRTRKGYAPMGNC